MYVLFLFFGLLMCVVGLGGYPHQSALPSGWFYLALALLSLAWIPKIKELEISLETVRNTSAPNRVGVEGGEGSTGGRANDAVDTSGEHTGEAGEGLTDGTAHNNDFGARWKMGIITALFKLLATLPTIYVIAWLNKTVGETDTLLPWNSQPLWRIDRNWGYFLAFLVNICCAFGVALLAVVACKSKLQLAFALSTVTSSVMFVLTAYAPPFCGYVPGLSCEDVDQEKWWVVASVVAGMMLAEVVMVLCICLSPEEVMEPEAKLFWVPGYNGVFLNQHLLLNKKTKLNSPQEFQKKHQTSKNTHVFICTTMFRESEEEMSQLIKSIRDMATSPSKEDRRKYESHILFDDGCKQGDLQRFAIQLLSIIHKMTKTGTERNPQSLLDECIKWQTPYGLQLQFDWKADGDNTRGMRFFIHLKDNLIVKNKKRWSQVMYMTYILDYAAYYKPLGMESGAIEDAQIKPPSNRPDGSLRLHGQTPWEGVRAPSNVEQVISIDLGEELWVTGIILQAGGPGQDRDGGVVTGGDTSRSLGGLVTKIRVADQEIQVPWPDTAEVDSTVTCLLEPEIWAKNLKIALLDWDGRDDSPPNPPCLRMEILGYAKGDLDRDTYILATDADVKFTPKSANSLLDLAKWNPDVGAVCGRTHCLGSGPMYWLQLFDYAVGHWFQKAANSTLGTVLCCPGCFSVYRCSAVRECVSTYATKTEEAKDFLMKDMGEDRWLCTLMVERGKRLVYTSIAEDSTFVPESFDEFFNQRRRWGPSTVANQIELLRKWKRGDINNSSVSFLFMLYQLLLFFSFLIGPATAILIASGGLDFYVSGHFPLEATIAIMSILTFLFGFICLRYKQDTQLKWAKALGSLFGVVMIMVMVALVEKIVMTIMDFVSRGISPPSISHNSTGGIGLDEVLPAVDTFYFLATIGMFLVTGLVHLPEFYCLFSGILYFLALPTTFIFLNIYGVCNLTDKSWGTREGASGGGNQDGGGDIFDSIGKTVRRMLGFSQESKYESNDTGNQDKPQPDATGKDEESTPLLDKIEEEGEDENDSAHSAHGSEQSAETQPSAADVLDIPTHIPNEDHSETPQQGSTGNTAKTANDNIWKRTRRNAKVSMMVLPGQEVPEWLATVFSGDDYLKNLYEPSFTNNGYDDTSYIAEMTSEDLEKIGVKDDLHRDRILSHIKKLKPRRFRSRIPDDTVDWLTRIGLQEYIETFQRNGIKEKHDLARLKAHNLQQLFSRLGVEKKAHIDRLKKSIASMREPSDEEKLHEDVRRLIERKQVKDMALAEPLMKKQHDIWEELRNSCLDPDRDMFSSDDAALKKQLGDLRDSAIKVLRISGHNPLGIASLFVFGAIQVIQFLAMLYHRTVAFLHWVARVHIIDEK
ncbi:CASKIN2 [Branchiostoma lanceolatum]|uniref:chitin synthase n=1 Tax=Branchiostoma lanceolatum TaxID=7740 RepID=A0A8K0A9H0_BRALA|nr:CASKIN2 [Branchiostoma lanceolatum]